jgi:hypothetical protein
MLEFPKLQGTDSNLQVLLEDFTYKDCTVKKGFLTNGSNVPRIFWNIIPPFKPLYSAAYVVHDYLCKLEQYELADQYFAELLYMADGVNFRTRSMVIAVTSYHHIRYGVD